MRQATTIPVFTLGDRLAKARSLTGYSREDFAKQLGIGGASVKRYETDQYTPSRATMLGWALFTGVDPDWLITGSVSDADIQSVTEGYRQTPSVQAAA